MDFAPYLMLATIEGLVQAAVLSLAALGLSLVFGVMRVVNVAHGEFFMIGAVIAWYVTTWFTGPIWLGFILAIAVAFVAATLIAMFADLLVLKRLNYGPEATIVATIGLLYIMQQSTLMTFGPEARPVIAPFNDRIALPWIENTDTGWQVYYALGFATTTYKLFVIATAIFSLLTVWYVMARTRIGLVLRATQQDRETAQNFGISVDFVYAMTFGVGAGLAAFAAVLIVPIQQAHYLMGGEILLLSFIVVIIGGLGSLKGTVLAAVLIGVSDGIISVFFTPTLAKILATLLVACVLIYRPQGLFGTARS